MYRRILIFLILPLFNYCSNSSDKTKPRYVDMTESVYASVEIVPKDLYDVYTSSAGILSKIFLKEGDTVQMNQILAQVSSADPKLRIRDAELALELARENYNGRAITLSNIEAEIRLAKEQVKVDSINYLRQKNLWDKNIGSAAELESRKLKYDLQVNQLASLKKSYDQKSIELKNTYEQALISLKRAQANYTDYFIRSKMDGLIYALNKNEGEFVNFSEPFAQIGQRDAFIVEMKIDEVDIAQVKIGQMAVVSLDAYPESVFETIITKIYPNKDRRSQTFKLEGQFISPPQSLYAGLSGEANIVVANRKNVLTVPSEYLYENQLKTKQGMVDVEIGLKNLSFIEILSGVDSSTIIIKPN